MKEKRSCRRKRGSGHCSIRETAVSALMLVLLVFSVLPALSFHGSAAEDEENGGGRTIFYFREQGTLSKEAPTANMYQFVSIPRAGPLEMWKTVGEWSYKVPEERAQVDGKLSYSYTLRNTGARPAGQIKLNFTLLKGTDPIKKVLSTHEGIAPKRARTFSASGTINRNYLSSGTHLTVKITASTFNNKIQFLFDSRFYDTSVGVDYSEANYPPSADAGDDISIREGEVAQLRGTGIDDDGYVVKYEWDFEGDGLYDWDSTQTGAVSHLYSVPGVYAATFRVTDDDGDADTDVATVTVAENKRPTVTIDTPGDGDEVNSTVVISGTAADTDGEVESVWVSFDGDMWHRAVGTANWTLMWDTTQMEDGPHVIAAKSNDSMSESTLASIRVTIRNAGVNPKPTCRIVSITPNPAFKLEPVVFRGEAEDDGKILTWKWTSSIDGVLSGERNFTHSSLTPGNHTVHLRVRDDNGSWSKSDSRLLVIKEYSRPKRVTSNASADREASSMMDRYGVFWCAWSSYTGGNWDIYVRSSVNGVEWGDAIKVAGGSGEEREPSLIQLANLTYAVVYSNDADGDFDIYMSLSDWGGYWSDPIRLTNGPYDEREPCIYQRSDGRIFLAYSVDDPSPLGRSIRVRHGTNILSLSSPVTATSGMSLNEQPSLVERKDGNVSVLFSSDRAGNFEIWQTVFFNEINFSTPSRVTYTVGDNKYPSVIRDTSSMFRMAYSDDSHDIYLIESADLRRFTDAAEIPTDLDDNNDPSLFQDKEGNFWVNWDSDDGGDRDIYALSFTGNSPPHSVITSPEDGATYFTSDTIQFDGSDSYDPNGDDELDAFEWRSDISGGLSTRSSFASNLEAGMHNITLKVTDIHGAEATDEVSVTVTLTPNKAPAADAGDDLEARVNETLTFDGSGSSDPDEDSLSYRWDFDGDGTWDDENETAEHAYNASGSYEALLLVEDPSGANDTDRINVTIADNLAPTAKAGGDQLVNVNATVEFDGTNSSDEDDETIYYGWDFDGDGETDSQSATPRYVFTERGVYTVVLTVTDPWGANDTDSVVITVNKPPVAVLDGDAEGYENDKLNFSAEGSYDEDGDELSYRWDFESDGEIDDEGLEVVHAYGMAGEYIVVLWVFDGRGGKDTTETEVVIEKRNRAPFAEAGEDLAGNVDEKIMFNSTGSYDPDDDLNGNDLIDDDEIDNLTYRWDTGDGETGNGPAPEHSYDEAGEYTVTLTVTDPEGVSATDSLEVIVNTPPTAKITLLTEGDIRADDEIKLTGSQSEDEDGDRLIYSWDLNYDDGISEDADGESIAFRYEVAGNYVITLTVDDGRGGNDTDTLAVTVKEKDKGPELDEPSVTIEKPRPNRIFTPKTRVVSVECKAEGEHIDKVVIRLLKDGKEEDTVTVDEDFDEIKVTFTLRKIGKYEIFARIVNEEHPSYTAYDSVNITMRRIPTGGEEEMPEGVRLIPFLPRGGLYQYGSIGGVAVVLALAVLFLVVRKKRRKGEKGAVAVSGEALEVSPIEVSGIEEEEEEGEGKDAEDIKKYVEPLTQSILCPECDRNFEVEDYGERPLEMECECGAKGKINTPVPGILKERIAKAEEERKKREREKEKEKAKDTDAEEGAKAKEKAKDTDAEGGAKAGVADRVFIRCPKCDAGFNVPGRKNITCPKCGAKGSIPKKEFERLMKKVRKAKRKREKKGTTEKDRKGGGGTEGGVTVKVACPKCDSEFYVEKDAKKVKCPKCGAKGRAG